MGKVQIVTGGTSGMGKATAKAISKYGPVVIAGRSLERMQGALDELKAAGVDAYGVATDISDLESVKNLAAEAAKLGEIGNVVNAAAVAMETSTPEQIARIDVQGTVNVVETFLPLMSEGSAMGLFSSTTGRMYQPTPEQYALYANSCGADFGDRFLEALPQKMDSSDERVAQMPASYIAYFAAKNWVMYYAQANASRFGVRGLRIFSVAPGSFETPMLPPDDGFRTMTIAQTALGRLGTPDEMASLFAALLDPSVAYLTGTDVLMDGGMFAKQFVPQLA